MKKEKLKGEMIDSRGHVDTPQPGEGKGDITDFAACRSACGEMGNVPFSASVTLKGNTESISKTIVANQGDAFGVAE